MAIFGIGFNIKRIVGKGNADGLDGSFETWIWAINLLKNLERVLPILIL